MVSDVMRLSLFSNNCDINVGSSWLRINGSYCCGEWFSMWFCGSFSVVVGEMSMGCVWGKWF